MGEAKREKPTESWWEPTRLEAGQGLRWRIGSLDLALWRAPDEWHLAWGASGAEEEPDPETWTVEPVSELPELEQMERYAAGESAAELRLQPRVADRSLVARPRTPLYVLPGERAKVYVSSPLWVDIRIGDAERSLRELPVKRLSDTWFGPSTLEGEVAYALKTQARTRLEEVPTPPHRCITPVVFENRGGDVLLVDRMNLPIPYLALYELSGARFWTQTVVLARTTDSQMAELDVRGGAPPEAAGARRISEPRNRASSNVLVRAFSSLMRGIGEGS